MLTPDERALMLQTIFPNGTPEGLNVTPTSTTIEELDKELIEVIEEQAPKPEPKVKKKAVTPATDGDEEAIVAGIIKRAGASKDHALTLCDEAAQAFFDQRKVSKVQAAKMGLDDRSLHNKPLWAQAQARRERLKTAIRKHYADNTVAAKITATRAKARGKQETAEDALLEKFVSSPDFQAMFAKFRAAQSSK